MSRLVARLLFYVRFALRTLFTKTLWKRDCMKSLGGGGGGGSKMGQPRNR